MDLAQLEAFVQVSTHHSFSKAAAALFLTQPSVTARIQSLERELGEALFERDGRGVRLTDVGAVFLPHAEHVLQALQESRDALESLRQLDIGSLRLGSALMISTYVLPRLLKNFREAHPGIEVSVRTARSFHVLQMVLNDVVQLALTRSIIHPDVHTIDLYEDTILLVTNPDHRFADQSAITLEEVSREPLILFDRGSSYRSLVESLFENAGIVPREAMELDSMEAAKKMVEEGLGISLLPRAAVEREIELGFLKSVEIKRVKLPSRRIALIYRQGRRPTRSALAFVALLSETYGFPWPKALPTLGEMQTSAKQTTAANFRDNVKAPRLSSSLP